MWDIGSLISLALLGGTVVVAIEYVRQLRRNQREYEKAKGIVADIVFSVDREVKRESEQIERIAYKLEGLSADAKEAVEKARKLENMSDENRPLLTEIVEKYTLIQAKLGSLEQNMGAIETSGDELRGRVLSIEEKLTKPIEELSIKVAPVIPIKRDRALAPLTETELVALELFVAQGPMTAPEIKDKINLSREHTARLMKKLYEAGYLERDPSRIPFKYSIKKEMEELLQKKSESTAATS